MRKKPITVAVEEITESGETPLPLRETMAPEEPEAPEPASEPAVAQVIPIQQYKITVDRFVIGMGTLGECFAVCEKMDAGDRTRKCTREAWQAEYEAWVSRPRG